MATDSKKPPRFRGIVRIIGWGLLAVIVWFVGAALIEAGDQVDWAAMRPAPGRIILGVALFAVSLALVDRAVTGLYRQLGVRLAAARGFILYMVPTLGRYIPGKVLSLAGHVIIARRYGVELPVSAAAITLLTVTGLTASTVVGLLFLIVQPPGNVEGQWLRWVLAAAVALVVLSLQPGLWHRLVNAGLRLFRRPPLAMKPGYAALIKVLGVMSLHVVFFIAGYASMTAGVIGLDLDALPILIGAMCIANTLGFVAVFAPAGIGVREGVLLILLGPTLGAGTAAVFAVTLRLVQIVGDAAAAGVGLAILRLEQAPSTNQAP